LKLYHRVEEAITEYGEDARVDERAASAFADDALTRGSDALCGRK